MAKSRESSVKDKISEVTECSICVQVFTNPKILPCVHTFCLQCLEKYGKDKKPGDQMVCPICRNEFYFPEGGLGNLPSNFLIGKMVEIGKMVMAPENAVMCDLCPEGEEVIAKMRCVDCQQILCERCTKSHRKAKFCQNHQVIELGGTLDAEKFSLRNSYCEHHPNELIKMYCYEDSVAICLICCVESHQSHKCVNVEKAAENFKERLKDDMRKVTSGLKQCDYVRGKIDELKGTLTEQITKTEEAIRDNAAKLKTLIDGHTEILIQHLKSVRETNFKAFEITKQDVDRFRVMTDSFSRYSGELISRGSPVDICRAADQMHTRASELEKVPKNPANHSGDCVYCETVSFQPSSFEDILKKCRSNNAVGELIVTHSSDRCIKFETKSTGQNSGGNSGRMLQVGKASADQRKGSANCENNDLAELELWATERSCSSHLNSSKTTSRCERILTTCPTKKINHCDECPSVRRCPNCGSLIEHEGMSAHVRCSSCPCEFCFICLKVKEFGHWRCGPYFYKCKLVPRQA